MIFVPILKSHYSLLLWNTVKNEIVKYLQVNYKEYCEKDDGYIDKGK